MKITKLGIEWGAAYEEAQPIRITHGDAEVEVYVTESGMLCVRTKESGWYFKAGPLPGEGCLMLEN